VWRAPFLRREPPELLTHQGWVRLDLSGEKTSPARPAKWRLAIEQNARFASESSNGKIICLGTHDQGLEIWDVAADRRLGRTMLAGPKQALAQVVALNEGCVTLEAGTARLYDRTGAFRILRKKATALAMDRGEILVAAQGKIHVLSPTGKARASLPAGAGVTAVARAGQSLVAGFEDGGMELVPTGAGRKKPSFTFEGTPASPVVRIVAGPEDTVIAGFGNGLFGLWSLTNGKRLEHGWLRGPVSHLMIKGRKLYVASDLGQHRVLDLGVFHTEYCDLMRQVWRKVPVVWEAGLPVLRTPPKDHRCARR
jgi:hypothetical protein